MKKLFFTITFYVLLYTSLVYGQSNPNVYQLPYMHSPQTWNFLVAGNIPVNQYTGRLNFEVPVYHYTDADFDIPISLGYNSSGFNPRVQSGPIGMNWFLNCGGSISRMVLGELPDDKRGITTGALENRIDGTLLYNGPTVNYSNVLNLQEGEPNFNWYWVLDRNHQSGSGNLGAGIETTPDLFRFDFLDHHGCFMIDHNKKVHVFDSDKGDTYLVEITCQAKGPTDWNLYEFSITTGDGYVYTFGGHFINTQIDDQALEFHYPNTSQYQSINSFPTSYGEIEDMFEKKVITSWHLRSIKAPNGREITFNYRSLPNGFPGLLPTFPPPPDVETYAELLFSRVSHEAKTLGQQYGVGAGAGGVTIDHNYYHVQKTATLESINIADECIINFSYSKRNPVEYLYPTLQMNNIFVQHNTFFKWITLASQYVGNRYFLTSINTNFSLFPGQTERYEFTYKQGNTTTVPFDTKAIDFWGFWNGNSNNNSLLPTFNINQQTGDISYDNDTHRQPCVSCFDHWLLDTIRYPTNGFSKIEYERHNYGQSLERRNASGFLPSLYTKTGYAGGARIKSITDHSQGSSQKREFIYKTSIGSNVSSGLLMEFPHVAFVLKAEGSGISSTQYSISSSSVTTNGLDKNHVVYSTVIEKRSDGSYTQNDFSSYENIPDDLSGQKSLINPAQQSWVGYVQDNVINGLFRNQNSRHFERGRLLRTIHFNNNNDTVRIEKNQYKVVGDGRYIASVSISGYLFWSYKTYTHSYFPAGKTIKQFDLNGQNPVTSVEKYDYNVWRQLSKTTAKKSDGTQQVTELLYPANITGGSEYPIAQKMLEYNIVSPYIFKLDYVEKGTNKIMTGGEYHKYSQLSANSPVIKPEMISRLLLNPGQNYASMFYDGTNIQTQAFDPYLNLGYNNKGRMNKSQPKDGPSTVYLWGYNDRYPTAQVENAELNDVAFTSFEDNGAGSNWTIAGTDRNTSNFRTGVKSYNLNTGKNITKTNFVANKPYKLSYWSKSTAATVKNGSSTVNPAAGITANGWTYFEHSFTPASSSATLTISGSNVIIDDLRLCAADALMSTYTYDPLIGMTSETGPSGHTVFYEYDSFGRLLRIKDEGGNIIQENKYHYAE